LDPNDPDAAETGKPRVEESEESTKTLEEYLDEKKASQNFRLQQQRKANEGSDDSQWKNTVVLEKEEDVFFAGGKV
jgi:plasminogen activator inhibitor 1 RNA-binding protein